MKEVGLVLGILQDQTHGGGFHRDAPILLVLPGVRVAYLLAHLPVFLVGVQHKEVHEGGLPMVHGAQEADVANQVGLVHHGSEEVEVKGRVRHLLLQEIEVFGLNGRDDGIRQRLGIFHLDQSFCIAIDFFCIRVILLVFVQNDLPVTTRLNALHGHITYPGAIIISLAFLVFVYTSEEVVIFFILVVIDVGALIVSELIVQTVLHNGAEASSSRTQPLPL
mmetsp:Transcript_13573/g.28347  ORF Transcript_13573/g.28347 Transcript_13573/m.28347 type:complete len:221 (-) Transcript_13573:15-677(-)